MKDFADKREQIPTKIFRDATKAINNLNSTLETETQSNKNQAQIYYKDISFLKNEHSELFKSLYEIQKKLQDLERHIGSSN